MDLFVDGGIWKSVQALLLGKGLEGVSDGGRGEICYVIGEVVAEKEGTVV